MGILGGIGNVLSNPVNLASLAMGPAGIVSIAARSLISAIGQNVIQQLGTALGVPQSTIDLAQGAFAAASGDHQGAAQNLQEAAAGFTGAIGGSAAEQGEAARTADSAVNDLVSRLADGEEARAGRSGGGGRSGGSWLMALAEALGEKLDVMAEDMASMADQITDKTPSLTAKFGAKTQEFNILMNAATNSIKTIGEGLANSARKG